MTTGVGIPTPPCRKLTVEVRRFSCDAATSRPRQISDVQGDDRHPSATMLALDNLQWRKVADRLAEALAVDRRAAPWRSRRDSRELRSVVLADPWSQKRPSGPDVASLIERERSEWHQRGGGVRASAQREGTRADEGLSGIFAITLGICFPAMGPPSRRRSQIQHQPAGSSRHP